MKNFILKFNVRLTARPNLCNVTVAPRVALKRVNIFGNVPAAKLGTAIQPVVWKNYDHHPTTT
jgi:hypothetical protein